VIVALNPPGQYADDSNLHARQRLWQHQNPVFDIAGWAVSLAGLAPGLRVLDAGYVSTSPVPADLQLGWGGW
jgi:hypothetical protein